jgi:NADH:ubiquinone oxidoreductase subunit E
MMALFMTAAEKVQVGVCSNKDCKRAGGGPRLEKMINEVLVETGLTDSVEVECVDCQGECGYGPNVVVDGKLVNGVRGRDAIMQALGIE